jgi:hypothetical protein
MQGRKNPLLLKYFLVDIRLREMLDDDKVGTITIMMRVYE